MLFVIYVYLSMIDPCVSIFANVCLYFIMKKVL